MLAVANLTKLAINVSYTTSNKVRVAFSTAGGKGSGKFTGTETTCRAALVGAIGELARIATEYGCDAEAEVAFNDAVQEVTAWKAGRDSMSGGNHAI